MLQVYFRKNKLQSKNVQVVPTVNSDTSHSNMRGANQNLKLFSNSNDSNII